MMTKNEYVILEIFWDRQLVKDNNTGQEYEIFRGKDYDPDWIYLGHGYSKDKKRIYYYDDEDKSIKKLIKNIDVETFDFIEANESDSTLYFKDKNNVYIRSYMCGFEMLKDANPKYFKIIDIDEGYSSSKNIDYWYDSKLPYSFSKLVPINETYQRVEHNIYMGHLNKLDCDVSTFEIVNPRVSTVAKDKNSVFFKNTKIPKANPKTFHFLDECIGSNSLYYRGCDRYFYAVDDQNAYFVDSLFHVKIIKTLDVKNFTFEVIDEVGYGKDSDGNLYNGDKIVKLK